jgi:hypothetical protein
MKMLSSDFQGLLFVYETNCLSLMVCKQTIGVDSVPHQDIQCPVWFHSSFQISSGKKEDWQNRKELYGFCTNATKFFWTRLVWFQSKTLLRVGLMHLMCVSVMWQLRLSPSSDSLITLVGNVHPGEWIIWVFFFSFPRLHWTRYILQGCFTRFW